MVQMQGSKNPGIKPAAYCEVPQMNLLSLHFAMKELDWWPRKKLNVGGILPLKEFL